MEALDSLLEQVERERKLRQKFYDEMTPEQKTEFIDGEVIMHSPAKNRHLDTTARLFTLINTHANVHQIGTAKTEKCLCSFPRNDYEPDIVFFGNEKARVLVPDTLRFPVPDLITEVLSDPTEERDRGVKFEDYATHGVSEYWIVAADEQTVEQHRLDGEQ